MVNELAEWFKEGLKKGFSLEELKKEARKSYSNGEINDALKELKEEKAKPEKPKPAINYLLALLSGLFIFSATLPKLHFLFLIAFIPLLVAISKGRKWVEALIMGLITGTVALICSFWFIAKSTITGFFISILLGILFFCAFCALLNLSNKKIKNLAIKLFLPALLWLFLIFIFSLLTIGDFFDFGFMFIDYSLIIPLFAAFSSKSVTFLVILINSSLAYFIVENKKRIILPLILVITLIIVALVYSFSLFHAEEFTGRTIKVALVQPNINESFDWRISNAKEAVFETQKNLTLSIKENVDLIVWPEYAIPIDIREANATSISETELSTLGNNISEIARIKNSWLIIGSRYTAYGGKYYDTALIFSPDGKIFGRYDSIKPAPFDFNMVAGKEYKIFDTKIGKIAIILCYEDSKYEIAREARKKGADYFVFLANDSPFGKSNGVYLHSLISRVRVAENNKYGIRVANTGISQIINNKGEIISKTKPYTRNVLIGEVKIE